MIQPLEYLASIPEKIPDGFFLVHNSSRTIEDFKAWLVPSVPELPECSCHRAPGNHFKHSSAAE